MYQTSCRRKKPSRWKEYKHTYTHTHTHTHTESSSEEEEDLHHVDVNSDEPIDLAIN